MDPAACMPGGFSIAFVSKKFLPLAFEGQRLKKELKVHSGFLPVGQWEKDCEGTGEGGLANGLVFIPS